MPLDSAAAVLAGRSDWVRAPSFEVSAAVMTAKLALGVESGQCSVADDLLHALFADGAAWVKIEAFEPAQTLPAGPVVLG